MTTGAVFTTSSHYQYRDLGSTLAYPFSILCWFDSLSASATERQIAAAYDPTKTGSVGIMHMGVRTSLALCAASYDDAATVNSSFGPVHAIGTYYTCAVVFAANNSRVIFTNGVTATPQTSIRTVASPTRIGLSTRIGANNVLPFNGNIYQAAWISRAVTLEEAIALHKGMSPLEFGRSLVAYLPCLGLQATPRDVMTGGTFAGVISAAIADTGPPNLHHDWLM